MPLELIVESPRKIGFASYVEREPVGSEVRVRTTVSGIKHGTEINMYVGDADAHPGVCARAGSHFLGLYLPGSARLRTRPAATSGSAS